MRLRVQKLRADVAVQADNLQVRGRAERFRDRFQRPAAGGRQAELRVFLAGADAPVGVRINAGRHPN